MTDRPWLEEVRIVFDQAERLTAGLTIFEGEALKPILRALDLAYDLLDEVEHYRHAAR